MKPVGRTYFDSIELLSINCLSEGITRFVLSSFCTTHSFRGTYLTFFEFRHVDIYFAILTGHLDTISLNSYKELRRGWNKTATRSFGHCCVGEGQYTNLRQNEIVFAGF